MSTAETQTGVPKYYLLYLPVLLALVTSGQAVTSYVIAWLGSLFIFYVSLTNKIKPTSPEIPVAEKILKPLFLTQIIFAGYMSVTSVFFFMDLLGFRYFSKVYGIVPAPYDLDLAAACQRYYLLGHAAFTHALLLFYKPQVESKYENRIVNWPVFCIRTALVAAPIGFVFSRVSALSILGGSISGLGLVAATVGLALAIPLRKTGTIMAAGAIYVLQLAQALTSGFKEPVRSIG